MRLMRAGGRLSLPSTRSRRPPRLRLLDGAYNDAPSLGCADAERAWLRAARALCFQVSAFSSLGVGRTLLEALSCLREVCVGARSGAQCRAPPRTDRRTAEVTSHVPLDLLK